MVLWLGLVISQTSVKMLMEVTAFEWNIARLAVGTDLEVRFGDREVNSCPAR